MNKPVILTGIRANNDLHIGNYFGALLPMIDMATKRAGEYQVNLMLADLHSFTTPIDHAALQSQIRATLQLYVAAGLPLDNPDVRVFRQSYIPAHSELTWILDCFTGMGELGRMTQFKDKSARLNEDRINVGLFNYPVLMASDILLYDARYVPVGEDQTQHLEFTRDIAMRLNTRFGRLFTAPKPVKDQHAFFGKDQGLRIKDLIDPAKKMSKSDETGRGIIFMSDDPNEAAKKIMGATTDSLGSIHFNREKQPGVSNLLQILALLVEQPLQEVVKAYEGKTRYGDLKADVAQNVKQFLSAFQSRLAQVDEAALQTKLESSEAVLRETANKTLARVQRAVGLRGGIPASQDEAIMEYSDELNKLGIVHEIKDHPFLKTPAETQAYLGLGMADGLSTMIMRTGDAYIAVLRRDDKRLDFDKLKTLIGGEVRMATPEEFVDVTGMPVGAARVFNPGLDTYLDAQLFEKEYLTGGSGSFTCSFRYKTEDLKKMPNVKIVDVLQ